MVGDGAGLSCEPDNPQALANSVLRLHKDKKLHNEISAASLAAGKRYDRETLAKQMLGFLEEVSN